MVWDMEMPGDVKGFGWGLGNLGGGFGTTVQLEGGGHSKAGTDLLEEEVRVSEPFCCCWGMAPPTLRRCPPRPGGP